MLTIEEIADYVNLSVDTAYLPGLVARAKVRIDEFLGFGGVQRIPEETYDDALLQLVSDKVNRRNAPNGVSNWSPETGVAIRVSVDDMKATIPILAPYADLGAVG